MEFSSNKPYLIRALHEWILDNQGTPHLIVNADYPGVQVPHEHVQNGEIVLNIAPSAVQGLAIENEEISFNARFSGVARVIRLPMNSVLAIIARENAQGMAFSAEESDVDMSPEVESEPDDFVPSEKSSDDRSGKKSNARKVSHLKVVK